MIGDKPDAMQALEIILVNLAFKLDLVTFKPVDSNRALVKFADDDAPVLEIHQVCLDRGSIRNDSGNGAYDL